MFSKPRNEENGHFCFSTLTILQQCVIAPLNSSRDELHFKQMFDAFGDFDPTAQFRLKAWSAQNPEASESVVIGGAGSTHTDNLTSHQQPNDALM